MSLLLRLLAWVELVLYVLWEIFVSSLRVAWEVLTPRPRARPGIIRYPLDVRRTDQITLLAHLITLTPGTLTLDVTPDRKALYLHVMFLDDVDDEIQGIKSGLERRMQKVLP